MKFHLSIDTDRIIDEASLQEVFATEFGFPKFYGKNWDAWIDCMTCLDEPEAGMSKIVVPKGELFVLHLTKTESFSNRCPDVLNALVECSAFVNRRRTEKGFAPILALVLE